ncbi:MAG TPA: hypothetical protein VNY73_01275 [Bacteroidia bacterium]|nr:hypothetical protein [Bacteroidia bacterium]
MFNLKNIFFACIVGAFIMACSKSTTNQNVQSNCTISKATSTPVNFTILSGSGQFFPISTPGGYIYVNNVGISGIIIYRQSASQFVALERNCTKDGCNNSKAIIWVQTGNTSVKDSICGSTYSILDGSIQTGPAIVPLYQYHTNWDGNQLHVSN